MNQAKNKGGFTLIELLIYTAIFSISVGVFSGVLLTFTRVGTQTSADAELTGQLAFVQATIQRLVRESANIENPAGVASSTLVLRMASSSLDPTVISSDENGIYLRQGTGEVFPMTNSQVKVAQFEAVKYENPNAHAIVQINLSLTYNSQNPYQQITRALKIAIGRVSAATFDDSLVPNVDNSYSLGIASVNRWKDINISNLLNVGQLTIDPVAGVQNGSIYYNTASNAFRGYTNGAWTALGGVGWVASGNNIYNTNSGNIGIGTASPTDTLEVNGSIIATGIQNTGKTTKMWLSGAIADKTLDYMEYSPDATAQAAYVTNGIVSQVDLDLMEYYSDGNAQAAYVTNFAPVAESSATGGTITTVGADKIHTFTSNGTFTPTASMNVQALVVAGGGAGGTWCGGGGGGGGVLYESAHAVTAQGYTVTIGNGAPRMTTNGNGENGQNSVFHNMTAIGGGGGGAYPGETGANGGSGGGAAHGGATGGTGSQGYNGAAGSGNGDGGGGGGGGEAGHIPSGGLGGVGGNGRLSTIYDGSNKYYGGGGGGWTIEYTTTGAVGGSGGGGNSSSGDGGGGVQAGNGVANTGGGGGGAWYQPNGYLGGGGGSGIVIIRFTPIPAVGGLQSYSESTIKTQGSYSLKGVAATDSLNKTLTRTISSPINLTDKNSIGFDIRSSRTGSNIKLGIHDTGGTTTEITPNITSAGAFQAVTWDLSGVSNANKDAIDKIIITIVNSDAANTFYIDNAFGGLATNLQSYSEATNKTQGAYALKGFALTTYSLNKTLTRTVSPTINLSNQTQIKFDIRSTRTGSNIKIGIHDSGGTTTETTPNIASVDTYQTVTWDISGVSNTNKDAIDSIIVTIVNADAANTFYIDNMYSPSPGASSDITFITSSSERMRIDSSGNVGIGTVEPTVRLEVNGNVKIDAGGSANKVMCWKSDGATLGYCSDLATSTGSCTCN